MLNQKRFSVLATFPVSIKRRFDNLNKRKKRYHILKHQWLLQFFKNDFPHLF